MKKNKVWSPEAWEDYVSLQVNDKRMVKKINSLIKDVERNGAAEGEGKPERLRGDFSGFWSRRIDDKNRLVYSVSGGNIEIASCLGHYGDK